MFRVHIVKVVDDAGKRLLCSGHCDVVSRRFISSLTLWDSLKLLCCNLLIKYNFSSCLMRDRAM